MYLGNISFAFIAKRMTHYFHIGNMITMYCVIDVDLISCILSC